MSARPRIVVAGAGIGGLTAALALLRAGFNVELHEQARALREVGAGVQLSANATRALAHLGVLDALRETACEAQGKEIWLWSTARGIGAPRRSRARSFGPSALRRSR